MRKIFKFRTNFKQSLTFVLALLIEKMDKNFMQEDKQILSCILRKANDYDMVDNYLL